MFGRKKRKILNLTKELSDLKAKLNKRDLEYSNLEVKLNSKDAHIREVESQKSLLTEQLANITYQLTLSTSLNDKLGVDLHNKLQQLVDLELNSSLVKDTFDSCLAEEEKSFSRNNPINYIEDTSIKFVPYDFKNNPNNFNRTKMYRLRNGELKLCEDGTLYSLYSVNFIYDELFCRAYLYATKDNVSERFTNLMYNYFLGTGISGVVQGKVDATFQIRMSEYKESFKNNNIDRIYDFTGLNI